MLNKFIKRVVTRLEDWCEKKGRVIKITGRQDENDVYLVRYILFRSRLFSIYIHRFLRSDRDDFHDHPFDFVSYIVDGGYTEHRLFLEEDYCNFFIDYATQGRREPGTLAFRKAEDIHMVFLDKEYKFEERKSAPLTVIFRGPYRREWGFWTNPSPTLFIWKKWNEYLGVPDSDVRE